MKKQIILIILVIGISHSNLLSQVAQLYRANITQTDTVNRVNLFDKEQLEKEVTNLRSSQVQLDSFLKEISRLEKRNEERKELDKKELEKTNGEIENLKKQLKEAEKREISKEKKEREKQEKEKEERKKEIKEKEEKVRLEKEKLDDLKMADSIHLIYLTRDAREQIGNSLLAYSKTKGEIFIIEKTLGFILTQDPEKREEIMKMHKQLFSLKEDVDIYQSVVERLNDTIETYSKYYGELEVYIKNLEAQNKIAKISFDTLVVRTERLMKLLQESEKQWKIEKNSKDHNEQDIIGALPQIAIKNKVAPSITLLGAKEFRKLGVHKISIYAGNDNDFDTTMLAQLITPEVSKYGINFSGTYNLRSITKDSSYKSVFNYLINLNSKDIGLQNQNFEFTQLNIKVGYENIVIDKVLSIYGSFNFNTPLSRKREFLLATNFTNTTQYYFDFGVKVLLGNDKINDFGFYLDLNFFNLTNDFKKLAKTEDSFGLSNIKVGVQKTF